MGVIWWGPVVLVLILPVVFLVKKSRKNRQLKEGSQATEGEMPVHWRYSDRNVMLVYVYLSCWLMRKSPRDPQTRLTFLREYFNEHFKGVPFEPEEEIRRALQYPVHVRSVANWVNKRLRQPNERKKLIDYLIALAFENGPTQMEVVALLRFSDLIGVRLAYIEERLAWYKERSGTETTEDPLIDLLLNRNVKRRKALEVLGLKDPTTLTAIKKAYRQEALKCHPDKMIHRTEAEQEAAAERFRMLQEAYEWLINEV